MRDHYFLGQDGTFLIGNFQFFWASRGAEAQSVSTGYEFEPHSRKEKIFKFIFPFLRSGRVKARRRVPALNTQYLQNVGNGVFYHKVPSAYTAVCGIQREFDNFMFNFVFFVWMDLLWTLIFKEVRVYFFRIYFVFY